MIEDEGMVWVWHSGGDIEESRWENEVDDVWDGCEIADAVEGAKMLANTLVLLLLTLLNELEDWPVVVTVVEHVAAAVCCETAV